MPHKAPKSIETAIIPASAPLIASIVPDAAIDDHTNGMISIPIIEKRIQNASQERGENFFIPSPKVPWNIPAINTRMIDKMKLFMNVSVKLGFRNIKLKYKLDFIL